MGRERALGQNLLLSSILAVLSYLPFEWIAKASLAVFALLFIVDPYAPTSRIISLVGVVVVGILSKMEKRWRTVNDADNNNNNSLDEPNEENADIDTSSTNISSINKKAM